MKITQIVKSVGRGGAFSRIAHQLANQFVQKGIEASLVTGCVLDKPDGWVEIHLVASKVVEMEQKNFNYLTNKIVNMLSAPAFHIASNSYVETHKRELGIVIDHTFLGGDVMVIHGCVLSLTKLRWYKGGERVFLAYPLNHYRLVLERLRYALKRFKKAIAVSNRAKHEIVNFYRVPPELIVVIPNGVDFQGFQSSECTFVRENIRKIYNIPLQSPLLLFVGHNFRLKGLKYIIEAMPKIKESYLLVAGAGDIASFKRLSNKLRVEDRVIFTGPVKKVNEFYIASDLFVFPTIGEGFPMVCLEAMASGLPILATKVGGVEDYLRDGYNGFFIIRDPGDIVEKVNMVSSDENLRRSLGENARKTAEKFDWSKIADKYIEVCKSL